jgi:hypothetical protein
MPKVKMLHRTHFAEVGVEVDVAQEIYDSYGSEYMELLEEDEKTPAKPTKKELSEELTKLGIEHDPKATNPVLEELLAKTLEAKKALEISDTALTGGDVQNTAITNPNEIK